MNATNIKEPSSARGSAATFSIPATLEAELTELTAHYPLKRSASLMYLHALQEHFGYLSDDAIDWTAARLDLQPIHVLELVTFYPMFRRKPAGRRHLRVCRTLSCAMAGAHELQARICAKLGLNPHAHTLQTTADGAFSVEFVECLASCGTAPVVMVNDDLHENVTGEGVDRMLAGGQP